MTELYAAGHRLEAAWHGPGPAAAPTLVLLHEGLGSVAMWRDWPAALAAATGLGVFVYSRRGYGASEPRPAPWPLTYMHEEAALLPAVLDAARIERALLVGHSDGGSIALIAAGRGEPRVAAVATLAAHVFCEELSVQSIARARDAFVGGDLRARLARYHGANVDDAFWGWNRAWLDPGFHRWNLEEYLAGIRVPLLAIQGADDEYGTLAQLDAIVRGAGGPTTRLLLPGCGHSPQRDRPAQTTAAIAALVAHVAMK